MIGKILQEKNAIITGGGSGLGYAIAESYVKNGCNVIISGRNSEKLKKSIKKLDKLTSKNKVFSFKSDVSNENDCLRLKAFATQKLNSIDILINNAGIHGLYGEVNQKNWNMWKEAISINLFGSVFLSSCIAEQMKKQNYGKIIQLSGGGATQPMPFMSAYAASKAGVVRYMETLSIELKKYNISVNSVAPGELDTGLLDDLLKKGKGFIDDELYSKKLKVKETGAGSFKKATDLFLFLASSESDGITGKLISAVWDNYKNWLSDLKSVESSDMYTLRRIVGSERNFKKGDV